MTIWLCNENHDEICHEGMNCPVCIIISSLEDEVEGLKEDIVALEKKLDE